MMDAIRKLIIALLTLALTFVCSIVSMIYGWGLEPKSWPIIILVGFGGLIVISGLGQTINKD